ncbi:Organic cation/carnitine transporter 4 [Apostasia shenzhenica]|uniref:H(+)/Pi cotransporter n=1 Tax=Apostasia shenzhenica TaxID=1088818 RepID=A0A2I0B7C6_9ASPA|nr:Organic cation/carnitine transporter 4 [Apostasia shenzhenica]
MPAPAHDSSDGLTAALLPPAGSGDGREEMGVDEMLQRFAGEFGRWQFRQFLFTSLAWVLCAFQIVVVVFADREPALPGTCPAAVKPVKWPRSTAEEWGLICGKRYKLGLAQSAFFAGSMAGAAFFGHLSDSFLGRKGVLTLTTGLLTAFTLLTALSPSFWFYAAARFFTGLSTGGLGLTAFILATEPVGPSFRAAAAMSTFHFFSLGAISLSLADTFIFSWRGLYAAISLLSLLFLLSAFSFISESPRWHLVRRKNSSAMAVMRAIAKANGSSIPDRASLSLADGSGGPTSSIVDVLRSPVTRHRLTLAFLINLLISVAYYGLTLNAGNLGGDLHAGVILNAAAEMPAYALTAVALRCHGRRLMGVGTMWLCGAFCAAGGLFACGDVSWASSLPAARMGCSVAAIFAVAATYNLLYIYTAELFPTAVRNAALGCVSLAGQLGAVAAPAVVAAGGRWPFAVFVGCTAVAGGLGWYLPETHRRPFYETLAGMEGGEGVKEEAGEAAA